MLFYNQNFCNSTVQFNFYLSLSCFPGVLSKNAFLSNGRKTGKTFGKIYVAERVLMVRRITGGPEEAH
jgi:hypothetical protein